MPMPVGAVSSANVSVLFSGSVAFASYEYACPAFANTIGTVENIGAWFTFDDTPTPKSNRVRLGFENATAFEPLNSPADKTPSPTSPLKLKYGEPSGNEPSRFRIVTVVSLISRIFAR